MNIKEVAKKKQKEYQYRYMKWRFKNRGAIMNTDAIRILACDKVLEKYSTVEDLEEAEVECLKKHKETTSPNGHYVFATTYREIINEIQNPIYERNRNV